MEIRHYILALCCLGLATALPAQSWKALQKTADGLMAQGNYAEAGQAYEQAWQKRQKNKDLIFKAGEAYYTLRDYRKAAEAYQHVRNDNEAYPLVGLKYARSLKQDGQYEKSITAFQEFEERYTGDGKAILQDVIRTEVAGCRLAMSLPTQADRSVEMTHAGSKVNTSAEEFGPFPASDDELWFTSATGGRARIYASTREGRGWGKAANPPSFPVVQGGQYGNGSFSPDGSRYYFTICSGDKAWEGLNTRCELFVTKRQGAGWSPPERLPDYINAPRVTSTHPAAAHVAGQEILYFASNRDGGRGGMDIWFVTRDLGADNNDFTFPVNAGPVINTLGDEITPFYAFDEGVLWFASNGHVSIGGFDVFKSQGEETAWGSVDNAGLPINSSADDYFFVKKPSGNGGFLVSNRVFGGEKTDTRHADIFEFTAGGSRLTLKGSVYDKAAGTALNRVSVSLYQLYEDGSENLLTRKDFNAGSYTFELLPSRTFRVEVASEGYAPATYSFTTEDKVGTYGQPSYLERQPDPNDVAVANPTTPAVTTPPTGTKPAATPESKPAAKPTAAKPGITAEDISTDGSVTYTAKGTAEKDKLAYTSSAPKHPGVYFKIQLAAVKKYNANHEGFQSVGGIGRLDTETLVDKSMTRVLIGDFFGEAEALDALAQARATFKNAYIVKYEDGVRYGKVNMD